MAGRYYYPPTDNARVFRFDTFGVTLVLSLSEVISLN